MCGLWIQNSDFLDRNNKSLWVPDITCHFVRAKQRDLNLNYLSLWVPALIFGFCMQNSDFRTRLTNLYWSQTSSVVLSLLNSILSTRINNQTSPFVLCVKNSVISARITSLYGFQPSPVIFCMQNGVPNIRITSLYGSLSSFVVFASKTATLDPDNKSL